MNYYIVPNYTSDQIRSLKFTELDIRESRMTQSLVYICNKYILNNKIGQKNPRPAGACFGKGKRSS
jgi:hypothetical protein